MCKIGKLISFFYILSAGILSFCFFITFSSAAEDYDWRSDWAIEDNFTISIDSEGYQFPTAIAFVPHPGNELKDPLYFVTELRGKVKVVTNDRSVYTFAEDFFQLKPAAELPAPDGEVGMAGICLDEENGYIFVTFSYQDSDNILRNNIVRFTSKPGTFSVKAGSMTSFGDIFSREESAYSHQIGPCQVYGNLLYVSVGDAFSYKKSRSIDSVLGKIIRMTLDGKPVKSNPFYVDDEVKKARNYVWDYGLRNPFGLKIVDGRIFVVENGTGTDRFLEVHEGIDYLWDGTDWSLGTNADVVFSPSVCPVQLDYYPMGLDIFPEEFRGMFYLALGGDSTELGRGISGDRSIVMLDYGFNENRMLSAPKHFLKYRGDGLQLVVGLAVGTDGLYFAPLFPDEGGRSAVLKAIYDESNLYPYKLSSESDVIDLLSSKGCWGCHKINNAGWGTAGPDIGGYPMVERIQERIDSEEYIETVKKIDQMNFEPYKVYTIARKEVLEKKDMDKVKIWIKYHLLEPKFDNPFSQMPNMGLSEHEAMLLADFLIGDTANNNMISKMGTLAKQLIPTLRYRYLLFSFILGIVVSMFFVGAFMLYRKK